jgi:hypothetical protein
LFYEDPVLHLKKLEEYLKLNDVPEEIQLYTVYKSMAGKLSSQWIGIAGNKIKDYQSFKKLVLETWWSPNTQKIVRCDLYQARHNKKSGLSLTAHFLKYANVATYLEPKPSPGIQRTMVNNKLDAIEEH